MSMFNRALSYTENDYEAALESFTCEIGIHMRDNHIVVIVLFGKIWYCKYAC